MCCTPLITDMNTKSRAYVDSAYSNRCPTSYLPWQPSPTVESVFHFCFSSLYWLLRCGSGKRRHKIDFGPFQPIKKSGSLIAGSFESWDRCSAYLANGIQDSGCNLSPQPIRSAITTALRSSMVLPHLSISHTSSEVRSLMSSAFVVQKHIVDQTAYTLMWTWLSTTGAIGVEPLFFILKFRLAMRAYTERRA